jgi:hypothetical protein
MSAPIVGHFVWTATGSDGWSFCVDGYRVRWFCDFYRPFFRLYMDCAVLLALVLICSSLFCDCPYVYIFLGLFGLFTIMYGLTSRFRKVICTVIQMYLGHSCCLYIYLVVLLKICYRLTQLNAHLLNVLCVLKPQFFCHL